MGAALISPDGRQGGHESIVYLPDGHSPPPSTPLSTAALRNVARAADEAGAEYAEAAMLECALHGRAPGALRKADGARSASTHRPLKNQYGSLLGRLKQSESVLRQLENAGLSRK